MTFTPGIPASGQTLGASRTQVLGNFTNYFDVISVNHGAPNGEPAASQGKHKFVEMPAQASDPATIAGEISTYCKTSGAGAQELYLRRASNGTVIQMSVGDPVIAASGSTFLPGGIIMKWGPVATGANLFTPPFPNNVYSFQMSQGNGGGTFSAIDVNGFTAASVVAPSYYLAIGN